VHLGFLGSPDKSVAALGAFFLSLTQMSISEKR
jgi:hypothetical protein